ncbi:MAG: hypothetical protein OXG35_34155 [Acidobacteria bacterium]|nr:hypothetical protein [Acidobacteriota bacterium]
MRKALLTLVLVAVTGVAPPAQTPAGRAVPAECHFCLPELGWSQMAYCGAKFFSESPHAMLFSTFTGWLVDCALEGDPARPHSHPPQGHLTGPGEHQRYALLAVLTAAGIDYTAAIPGAATNSRKLAVTRTVQCGAAVAAANLGWSHTDAGARDWLKGEFPRLTFPLDPGQC